MALGSTGSFHANVAVVDLDKGQVAAGFTSFVKSPDLAKLLTVTSAATEADARAMVNKGDLGAAFVIPQGFSDAVTSGNGRPISILTSVDSSIAGQVAQSLAESYTAQIEAVQLSVKTALAPGAPAASVEKLAVEAAAVRPPEQTVMQPAGTKALTAILAAYAAVLIAIASLRLRRSLVTP